MFREILPLDEVAPFWFGLSRKMQPHTIKNSLRLVEWNTIPSKGHRFSARRAPSELFGVDHERLQIADMKDVMYAPIGRDFQLISQVANFLFDLVGPNPFRLQLGSRTRQGQVAR